MRIVQPAGLTLIDQTHDTLTFRASYGQGFRAPTLDILTAQPSFSADGVNDPPTCAAFMNTIRCVGSPGDSRSMISRM